MSYFQRLTEEKKLLIFDLDATLIDSFGDIAFSVNTVLQDLQLPDLPTEEIKRYIGVGAKHLLQKSLEAAGGKELFQKARDRFVGVYSANLTRTTVFFPGAEELLDKALASGLTLALCTNKPMLFVEPLLESLQTNERFSIILAGDSLPEKKPSPLPLLHIMNELGMQPETTVMFGDSIYDVEAGKRAGVETCAFPTGHHSKQVLQDAGADVIFGTIQEVLEGK